MSHVVLLDDSIFDNGASVGAGPAAFCTIYNSNYLKPRQRSIVVALALFNDVITRVAFEHCLPLVDLWLICGERAN